MALYHFVCRKKPGYDYTKMLFLMIIMAIVQGLVSGEECLLDDLLGHFPSPEPDDRETEESVPVKIHPLFGIGRFMLGCWLSVAGHGER